jgi:C-terminal processing protease CtpA/Prc
MFRRFSLCCGALVALLGGVDCGAKAGTIGARLGRDPSGHVVLREVPAGLGADKSGLRVGDEVLLVDGRDVRELTAQQLHAALAGELGARVNLTVLRGDEVIRVTVERTAVPSKRVER